MASRFKTGGVQGRTLDMVERLTLVVLFTLLVARMVHATVQAGVWFNFAFVLAEALVLFFVVTRRATDSISTRPWDWAAGFLGTGLPLMAVPADGDAVAPVALCALLVFAGLAFQIAAKLTLRRNFGVVAANRGIKASGPYRIVRHPMYAGYIVTQVGFFLSGPSTWNLVLLPLAWGFQVCRIVAEERILEQDPAYGELRRRTPYRLLPGVF